MSGGYYNMGLPPGPQPDASGPEAAPCARCGHRADSHLHPGFVLRPGPLVATLWMQWLHQARFGYPSRSWTAVAG
jgi:hypothetical protein